MRIIIVEDDPLQLDNVKDVLAEAFEDVEFLTFATGAEYLDVLPSFLTSPPDILLMDVMLPWRLPESTVPPPLGGWETDKGGLTLISSTREYEALLDVPAIIWTVVHSDQIAGMLPSRTVFISKETPYNHLVTVIRSLLISVGITPIMRQSKWSILATATEIKPSIYGISVDLKKIWSSIRKAMK